MALTLGNASLMEKGYVFGCFRLFVETRIQTTKINMYLPGEFYVGPIGFLHS